MEKVIDGAASGRAANDEASSSEVPSVVDDVDGLMARMGLREDELDDVVFEEMPESTKEATRWLAVGKVHTDSTFSHYWFFKNMRSAWDLAKDVKIRVHEDNLFVFQFACLGDWEKVMNGGPWVFRGKSVLLAPYDGFTKPSTIDLNSLLIWIQIHDLPVGYKDLVKSLASKVGEFDTAEPHSTDYTGNFYRARVRLDVRKQLKLVVSIIRNSRRQIFLVKYERLPDWCAMCGFLGHTYKEHGDGVHPPDALIFKDLRADGGWRPSSRPLGRGTGRGFGRGGRGARDPDVPFESLPFNQRLEGDNVNEMDEDDPLTNDPSKKHHAIQPQPIGGEQGMTVDNQINLDSKVLPPLNAPPFSPLKRDPKRSRSGVSKVGDGISSDGRSGGLAMYWNNNLGMELIHFSQYHIDMKVPETGKEKWRLTCIYDYNEVLWPEEHLGIAARDPVQMRGFREAVDVCGLIDLGYIGRDWTFEKKVRGGTYTRVRLDRGLASLPWWEQFPNAVVRHLTAANSDHCPLLVILERSESNQTRGVHPFRYELMWETHDSILPFLEDSWKQKGSASNMQEFSSKILALSSDLSSWNADIFGNVRQEIRQLSSRMVADVQNDKCSLPRRSCHSHAWVPPPAGMCKVSVDAALSKSSIAGAAGAICRDENGVYLGASARVFDGINDPMTLEAFACSEGLALAQDLGVRKIQHMITACKLRPVALLLPRPSPRPAFPCIPAIADGEHRRTGAASRLVVRRRCQEEKQQSGGGGGKPEKRTFLSLEEAGLVEMSGLSTHERFLCRLTISSLNLLRVISEQEGVAIEELNAGRVCDWFLKDKLKQEQNIDSAVLQWDDPAI
ncbi:hypothetical protein ACQ4PT_068445 [Festuca glaucescens]